jgi:hypothetical protein
MIAMIAKRNVQYLRAGLMFSLGIDYISVAKLHFMRDGAIRPHFKVLLAVLLKSQCRETRLNHEEGSFSAACCEGA